MTDTATPEYFMQRALGGSVLFVFPHPDDDVFIGGTLSMLVRRGARVDAAWMTSGDYDGQGKAREAEIDRAMAIAGVARRHLLRLPEGGLTGVLERACADLCDLIMRLRPDAVIGPAFEGGHADHDATSFAIAEACRRAGVPMLQLEYPCYAPDPDRPDRLRLSAFPPCSEGVTRMALDAAAMACKQAMMTAYASQRDVFALLGWRAASEEFLRICPPGRDHRRPPCRGLDSYAHWFNWRSRDRFPNLAQAVAAILDAPPHDISRPARAMPDLHQA